MTKVYQFKKEELFDLFINKKMTALEIAKKYNMGRENVKQQLGKFNIRRKLFETPQPTVDLKAEADKIADEMLRNNGVEIVKHPEPVSPSPEKKTISEELQKLNDEVEKTMSDTVPMEWQGIFNMVTRMYESYEEYKCVRYIRVKNILEIELVSSNFVYINRLILLWF